MHIQTIQKRTYRRTFLLCAFFIYLFTLAPRTHAQTSYPTLPAQPTTWRVETYDNAHFDGNPVVTSKTYPAAGLGIQDDWNISPFQPFSARFTGEFTLAAPTHVSFFANVGGFDGHIRVLIDGRVILDQGQFFSKTETNLIDAGRHSILVEYKRTNGRAAISLNSGAEADMPPIINSFVMSPSPRRWEEQTITVSWNVSDADNIILSIGSQWFYDLPATGSRTINRNMSNRTLGRDEVYAEILVSKYIDGDFNNQVTTQARTRVPCANGSWFFVGAPQWCSVQPPEAVPMEMQQFEHGVIIYNKSNQNAFAFYTFGDGQTDIRNAIWNPGDPADSNPDVIAPPGRIKPVGIFGKLWAMHGMRENLGWALSEPVAYEGWVQCGGLCYYATPTNDIYVQIGYNYEGPRWEKITRQITLPREATVTPAPTNPTSPNSDCVIPPTGPWPPCAINGNTNTTNNNECVIPSSGPWPPCATGGHTTPSNPNTCVIPPSGPWPPCATGGGGNRAPPTHNNNGCVIPASGPWPPCATAGDPPPPNLDNNCAIPPSGPWPACARGG